MPPIPNGHNALTIAYSDDTCRKKYELRQKRYLTTTAETTNGN